MAYIFNWIIYNILLIPIVKGEGGGRVEIVIVRHSSCTEHMYYSSVYSTIY
jgi:hypothetical protein